MWCEIVVSEVSASTSSSCINLSAVFIPCCPCIFLTSYGTKGLENDCRCFTCVCLFTEDEKPSRLCPLQTQGHRIWFGCPGVTAATRPVVLDVPSGAIFSLPGKDALRSSWRATALIAAAPPPSCVLSARTSFSPLSLDSSAGEKVYFLLL